MERHSTTRWYPRIQSRQRFLKDHANSRSTQLAHGSLWQGQEVLPVEENATAADACDGARQQAHNDQRGYALAASRLAHQPQYLATPDGEGNALHHVRRPLVRVKRYTEIIDAKQNIAITVHDRS